MPVIQLVNHNKNGLRPRGKQLNAEFFSSLRNMRPQERGLRVPQSISYAAVVSSPAQSFSHPIPQIVQMADDDVVLFGASAIYPINVASLPDSPTAFAIKNATRGADEVSNGSFSAGTPPNPTSWTLNTGWAWNDADQKITHTAGNTGTAQQTASVTNATICEVAIKISDSTAGTVTITINGGAGAAISGNGWTKQYLTSGSSGAVISITPSSSFTGSIEQIIVKELAAATVSSTKPWHAASFRKDLWFATDGEHFAFLSPTALGGTVNIAKAANGFVCNTVCNHNNRLMIGGMSGTVFAGADWLEFFATWQNSELPDADDTRRDMVIDENQIFGADCVLISERGGGAVDKPYMSILAMLSIPDSQRTTEMREYLNSQLETAGIMILALKQAVANYSLLPFNENVVMAYNKRSVSALMMTRGGQYVEKKIMDVGIAGRGCAGGGAEQLFVSTQGEVYMLGQNANRYSWAIPVEAEGLPLFWLGYKEYMDTLTLANAVISYDPREQEYWISDGTTCFCLTRTGLFESRAVRPSSVVRLSDVGGLIGTGTVAAVTDGAYFQTETFDGALNGVKEVAFVRMACEDTDPTGWTINTPYRQQHQNAVSAGATSFVADERGFARTKQTGVEHAVRGTAAEYDKVTVDRIEVDLRVIADTKPRVGSIITP